MTKYKNKPHLQSTHDKRGLGATVLSIVAVAVLVLLILNLLGSD